MTSSTTAIAGGTGLWVPHTICLIGTGGDVVIDYTVSAGPAFALTYMQFETHGAGTEVMEVTDNSATGRIWHAFGGTNPDDIHWDGLLVFEPGSQIQFTRTGGGDFRASGYFVGRPSGIDYKQSHFP